MYQIHFKISNYYKSYVNSNFKLATCLDNEAPTRADPCGYVTLRLDTPPTAEVIRIPVVQEVTTCPVPPTSAPAVTTSATASTTLNNAQGGGSNAQGGGTNGQGGGSNDQWPPNVVPPTVTAVDLVIKQKMNTNI